MTDRKKPGVAFWATVVVALVLVGYPLSYGPFAWFEWSINVPKPFQPIREAAWRIYEPCYWLYDHGPKWYREYINWCARNGLQRPTHI